MAPLQFFVVNAFSSVPFRGNPATVVIVPRDFFRDGGDEPNMRAFFQRLGQEIAQVETAFVIPPDHPKTDFTLRFFTKAKEMPFCGHATLAAAHVLATEFNFPSETIYFSTATGVVIVKCTNKKVFQLDLSPTMPVALSPKLGVDQVAAIAAGLNISASKIVDIVIHEGSQNLIVVLKSATDVVSIRPEVHQLLAAVPPNVQKLTATAQPVVEVGVASLSTPTTDAGGNSTSVSMTEEDKWKKYDFITRLFAPWIGVSEDAVSGASHAILAQYWRSKSPSMREKSSLLCFQPSVRGGEIMLNVAGARVGVSGEAVTIAKGIVSLQSRL